MAHVIIKCRVTFGKEMFNDCIKPHSICMRLVLSTQEEFSLKRAHYGHSPLHSRELLFPVQNLMTWNIQPVRSLSIVGTEPFESYAQFCFVSWNKEHGHDTDYK